MHPFHVRLAANVATDGSRQTEIDFAGRANDLRLPEFPVR